MVVDGAPGEGTLDALAGAPDSDHGEAVPRLQEAALARAWGEEWKACALRLYAQSAQAVLGTAAASAAAQQQFPGAAPPS